MTFQIEISPIFFVRITHCIDLFNHLCNLVTITWLIQNYMNFPKRFDDTISQIDRIYFFCRHSKSSQKIHLNSSWSFFDDLFRWVSNPNSTTKSFFKEEPYDTIIQLTYDYHQFFKVKCKNIIRFKSFTINVQFLIPQNKKLILTKKPYKSFQITTLLRRSYRNKRSI